MVTTLSPATREALARVSVATLSTVLFKRGLRRTVLDGVVPLRQGMPRLVGPAFTLRTIPSREDIDTVAILTDPAHPQRRAIETCPAGSVLVIDSRGDALGSSGGDILLMRLWRRGAAGVVSDGGFRDTPDLRGFEFPVYQARASAPISLSRHHAVDVDVPIACGGVAVYPGDVIVGDGEAVIAIPRGIVDAVAEEALAQTEVETFVQEEVSKGASIFGLYPMTDEAWKARFEAWRKARG